MLGNRRALLMVAHGCVVVGASVPLAVHAAITLRDNIVIQLGSVMAGRPKYITRSQAKHMIPLVADGQERAWSYYVNRAGKVYPEIRHYAVAK
jgi:ribulose-5-phosphate 4-epimerase/fuculose-1-phosphate aldolase